MLSGLVRYNFPFNVEGLPPYDFPLDVGGLPPYDVLFAHEENYTLLMESNNDTESTSIVS